MALTRRYAVTKGVFLWLVWEYARALHHCNQPVFRNVYPTSSMLCRATVVRPQRLLRQRQHQRSMWLQQSVGVCVLHTSSECEYSFMYSIKKRENTHSSSGIRWVLIHCLQCTAVHAHTYTLHTQQMVASTWLGDHQGRPSAHTNSLHKLHMARYQVLLTITIAVHGIPRHTHNRSFKCVFPLFYHRHYHQKNTWSG